MKKNLLLILIVTVLSLILPVVLSSYGVKLATEVYIMAIFVLSLGFIIGYSGLVSLGHAAFYGIGAYTVAILGKYVSNTYLLIILAIILAGFLAWLSGWLFIRSSGAYFLMITLAFSQMVYAFFYKVKPITGGADGMSVPADLNLGFGRISDPIALYYVMAIAFLICFALLAIFVISPAGKSIKGVMENESRMKALGFSTLSYKLIAYTISGMMAGFAGALYAYYNAFVSPDVSSWMFSGQALVMVIIGGVGTLVGPPIGAAVFVVIQNYISSYTERWPIIMGIIFIAFVLYGRGGIAHFFQRIFAKRTAGEENS